MNVHVIARQDVPDWVKEQINITCPYCGFTILNNYELTARWCSNPKCRGHMAYKIIEIANHYNIKGIGPATARNLIVQYKLESHFDILPIWFKEQKLPAHLYDIAVMACIEGYGNTQAEKELSSYATFEDYFTNANVNPLLTPYKDMLIDAQKHFIIAPPLSKKKMLVMATGAFHGYSSRDQYFAKINQIFGNYIHVIQTGKRKTGVSFLLKEHDAVDHSKSQIARECGIPIITPQEFLHLLREQFHI